VRESLAADAGYRRIIRTDLFNPRLIDAVTSEFGDAEVEAGVDFVDYAVSVLEDPETLWRRAFETQIGLREHALLYTLASMPTGPVVGDVRTAYEPVAATIGVPVDASRFERALEVLDDSLVETSMEEGQHVLRFINPSVEDFVGGRVRRSASLVRELIAASTYFEQVVGLVRILRKDGLLDRFRPEAVQRTSELLDTEPVAWSRFQSSFGRRSLAREEISPESRLEFLLGLIEEEEPRTSEICDLVAARVERLPKVWDGTTFPAPAALALTKRLLAAQSPVAPTDQYLTALRERLVASAQNATDHRRIAELHDLRPGAFLDGEFQKIKENFVEDARWRLEEEPSVIESRDELDLYGVVAEEFGMPIEESLLDAAAEEYREAEESSDAGEWEDIDYDEYKERHYEERAEEREMDALFERLADD
jgi:hypothetical protein